MFQKKNRIQYIEFLEKKYKSLILENKNLKKYNEMLMNNNLNNNENINNMNKNIANNKNINNYYSNNNNKQNYYNKNNNVNYNIEGNNNIYKTPNVTDRKSNLKKIQVKKSDAYQNSIKYSPYISRYDENLKTEDIWRLPDRLLKTPLIMKSDDEGITNMIIYSGFIGMSVDKEKNNLVTPEIGWYVKEKSSKDNNEKHNNIRHPFDYDDSSSDN